MIRPQKKFTNGLIDQWEQNLLLKVMERKIKTAKSTIPGAKKSYQQSTPTILKSRNACSLDWKFSDLKSRLPLVETSNPRIVVSISPRQLDQREKTKKLKEKNTKEFVISPTKPHKIGGAVTINELKDGEEIEKSSSVSPIDETVCADVSDGFLTDDFEDTDDDLLSQLWSTCRREDTMLDDTILPKQGQVGPTTTAVIYLSGGVQINNTTTLPDRSKLNASKENRLRKNFSLGKKSKVRDTKIHSKIMKKREDGWRE